MDLGLKGRHVAVLAADGVDAAQLNGPREALTAAGAAVDVVAAGENVRDAGGEAVPVGRTFQACHAGDFDALLIPGGRRAVDALAQDQHAVQLVREFMAADKPVAAIGDGVRLLIAADAVAGRSVAVARELMEDVRSAGGEVVDAPVHVDDQLITARSGADSGHLNAVVLRGLADQVDQARTDQLSEQSFPASDPPPGPMSVGGEGASATRHLDPQPGQGAPGSPSPRDGH